MKLFIILTIGILVSLNASANGIYTSPAEFGDIDSVRVYANSSQKEVAVQISGVKAKEIYDALDIKPSELPGFPGTVTKITSDDSTRCFQINSPNDSGVIVVKTRCMISFRKK
jgi:hypothetical protein